MVWAPEAHTVELVTAAGREPLSKAVSGWWLRAEPIAPGTDYRFSLDGADPLPDPRSPWQPEGPHGPSRALDHSRFEWSDSGWDPGPLADAVIYECHIGTFTPEGTFDAAIDRLDHLVELGVTALELLPVAEFPGRRGWGYDGVDLYAPHHAYGGPDGLKRLIDAAHSRGLAVIVDVVYNHLGPDGNYLGAFAPYFTDRYATPWGQALNFDGPDSIQVRSFFIENTLMWLRDYHFDGVRLDAIHAIIDTSAIHFLEELQDQVETLQERLGRTLWVIAESDLNDPRVIQRRDRGGFGLDAQWSDDFHHALHSVLTGETSGYYSDFWSLAQIAKALRNAFVYDGAYSRYRRRVHGKRPADIPGCRFLGYLQNHDQIGNRAQGERSSALMTPELLKVGATLVLTAPFVPMLFQGEEWGASTPFLYFTEHNPELGRLVSEGRKKEFAAFGWDESEIPDPQDPATFERSKLDWRELEDPHHADILAWHRDLLRLRRDHPELRDGAMSEIKIEHHDRERWIVIEKGSLTIACNLAVEPRSVPLRSERTGRLVLASGKEPQVENEQAEMAPGSVAIWAP